MASDFANELKTLGSRLSNPASETDLQTDLQSVKQLTEVLLTSPDSLSAQKLDSLLKSLPVFLTSLLSTRKADTESTQQQIADVLSDVMLMLPKHIQHPKYLEALRLCVDYEKPFFKVYGQESAMAPGFSVHPELVEEEFHWWKATLGRGDEVDAVKIDTGNDRKCWAQAKVTSVESDLSLTVAFEEESSGCNRLLSRWSPELAPLGTYTRENQWRKELKEGDLLDAFDTANTWYNSTIFDRRVLTNDNGGMTVEVYVGYRIYESSGEKTDEHGRYRGWSSKYDEWISVQSPRLAPFNLMARKWLIPAVQSTEEMVIEDSNDVIEQRTWAFAMSRGLKSRSKYLVRNINRFGVAGLFDFVVKLISSEDEQPSLEMFCGVMDFCGKIYAFYHKRFARMFVERLIEAAMTYLLTANDSQVRTFSKEKMDAVCGHFENLYKRLFTIQQKNEKMDEFNLALAVKFFQSQYLERRIQGLKVIVETVKNVRFPLTRSVRPEHMVIWIRNHSILEGVFGPQGHTQLIQRSGDILHLLLTESSLYMKDLALIWSVAERTDEDSKVAVYKILGENSSYFRAEHLEFLVEKISAIPPQKLLKEEIELVHDLTKYPLKAGAVLIKACELLWKIVLEDVKSSGAVAEQALDRFCEVMKGWDMRSSRLSVLVRCVHCIRENKAVIQSLKVIKKILPSFPISATTSDILTKPEVEETLIAGNQLMTAFFDNFRYFKDLAKSLVIPGMSEEAVSTLVVCDRTPYKEQIEERLSFLQNLYSGSRMKLTQTHISLLWETCLETGLCQAEKTVFLTWLAEVTDGQSPDKAIIDETGAVQFFHDKVAQSVNDLSHFPAKAFLVFRNYFLLANVILGRMRAVPKPMVVQTSGFYNYNTTYSYAPDPPPVKEFEYEVLSPPQGLEGMDSLRELILETELAQMAEDATEFLSELYDNLAPTLQESLAAIRMEFIDFCKAEISKERHKVQGVKLLKRFLEESEKQGTGGLKSHSAMLRGELYSLTIINNVTYHFYNTTIPKKVDLKVYGSMTIWELRCLIGTNVKLLWDQVRLTRSFTHREIKDNENGKTLTELRLKTQDTLVVTRKQINIPKGEIMGPDGELTENAKKIFLTWYKEYADKDGKMGAEGCANFTNSCTGDHCKPEDNRVQQFFMRFDDDNDGVLTEKNFLEFYKDAAAFRSQVVWNNLYSHNYRNDLKCYLDMDSAQIDVTSLPRFLLTQDQSSFDLLFSALSDPQVANEAWELIIRLPTNLQIKARLSTLDCSEETWDELLDPKSVQKLLYSLQIIEALIESPLDENPEERHRRTQWKLLFLEKGGFKHLYGIIKRLESREDVFHKNCLAYILSLVSVYMLAAFKALEPEIYEAVEFVRRGSEMLDSPTAEDNETEPKEKTVHFSDSVETQTDLPVYGPQLPEPQPTPQPTKEVETVEMQQQLTQTKAFQDLVEALKQQNAAGTIIANINFADVMEKLIVMISGTLELGEYENEDKHIIEASLALLVSCVLHNHQLISIFYTFCEQGEGETFIFRGITCPKTITIRKSFSSSLLQICLHVEYEERPPRAYFLEELLRRLPQGYVDSNVADYTQYFELICSLVEEDLKAPSQDYTRLITELMDRVIAHPYQETRIPYSPDKVLQGLLQVAEKVFLRLPQLKSLATDHHFVTEILKLCLFPEKPEYADVVYDFETVSNYSAKEPPKCKLRDSRSAAYRLLVTLATDHATNMQEIVSEGFEKLKARLDKVISWNYSPSSEIRSVYGYAGIVNLGCICYMISMLQQFYMIPQFRYAILEADDKVPPTNLAYLRGDSDVDRTKKGVDVDENVLHQLQSLFGYLELTEKQAYNPSHFCYAFKDFEGNPTNIALQQDSQEFLNMVFDKLERGLKGTRQEFLLQSVFGGKVCNRFICQGGCNVTNERYEDFFNLSLDVKHSKSLYESLERYISGETINDFYCEACDRKVDMVKKTCLSHLPNVLIVHLQRIIFNFDSFANEKINSRLEFPQTLNLEPYSREGVLRKEGVSEEPKPDLSEYEYELMGVVVHSGTAEVGHYISYIRHKLPDGSVDPKKWFEFNDSLVRYYNPDQLEADCFGGVSDTGDDFSVGYFKNYSRENSRSAYMLVYERKVRKPLKLLQPILEGDSTTSPRTQEFEYRSYDQVHKAMPVDVLRSVLLDNEKFNFERSLYSPEFFRFFADTLQASVAIPSMNLTKLGTQFALDVMAHAFDNRLLPDITVTLKQLFSRYSIECVELFENILADNMRTVLELLLICTEKTTRSCVADLLAHVLNILMTVDSSEDSLAKRFMSGLLDLVPKEAHKHWVRFQQFWELFRDFSAGGAEQAQFMIEKGAIGILIDFYLGNKSPLLKPEEKRATFGNKIWGPSFDGLIQTISILADYCAPDPESLTVPGLWLDSDSQICIMDREFVDKTLRGGYDGKALGKIIAHWGKGNFDYSHMVAHVILKVLNEIEYDEVKGLYDVLDYYITIPDKYQRLRVEWIMGFPVPQKVNREDLRYPYFGCAIINAIDDEVWTYLTPLCFGHNYYDTTESILSLIWRHRKRWDQYCVVCIKNLFGICLKSQELANYMQRLPAPTYQYARYIDWIEQFLDTFKETMASWASSYTSKKDDALPDAVNIYNAFKQVSADMHPFPFILGKTISSRVFDIMDVGEVSVSVYEYTTFYTASRPNGKMNDALPGLKLRSEAQSKTFTNYRPAQLNLESQNKSFTNYTSQKVGDDDCEEEAIDNKQIGATNIPMKTFVTNAKEEKPEVTAFEEVVDPVMDQEAAILIRFVAKNGSSDVQRVVLAFKGEGERNYSAPESEVAIELSGKTEKDIITIMKSDPTQDWGTLLYTIRCEAPQTFVYKNETDEYKDTMAGYYAVDEAAIPISDVASIDDDSKAPAGKVSCPKCTLHNSTYATKCEACGSSLKSNT